MKLNIIRVILSILLLGTFYLIFGFSSQEAEESRSVSRKVSETIVNITNKNKTEKEKSKLVKNLVPVVRKLAHFSIYTLVGCLLMGLCCTYNLTFKQRLIICLTIGFLYACSDEIHQLFVKGRSGEIRDVLIDISGVLVGIGIVCGIRKIWRKFH